MLFTGTDSDITPEMKEWNLSLYSLESPFRYSPFGGGIVWEKQGNLCSIAWKNDTADSRHTYVGNLCYTQNGITGVVGVYLLQSLEEACTRAIAEQAKREEYAAFCVLEAQAKSWLQETEYSALRSRLDKKGVYFPKVEIQNGYDASGCFIRVKRSLYGKPELTPVTTKEAFLQIYLEIEKEMKAHFLPKKRIIK